MSTRVADPTDREQQLLRDGFQVKPRIHPDEMRDRYGDLFTDDIAAFVGVGWREIVIEALDDLAGTDVLVTLIREKLGGLQIIGYPRTTWRNEAHMRSSGDVCRRAWARSLETCEVCGNPGERTTAAMPIRTRCDAHRDVI